MPTLQELSDIADYLSKQLALLAKPTREPKLKILTGKGWAVVAVAGRNLVILRRGNGEIVYNADTKEMVEMTPWVGDIDEED